MDRQSLLQQLYRLRREDKSIRAIASELGVHPSRVQRALRSLDQSVTPLGQRLPLSWPKQGIFVGRQRELAQLTGALGDTLAGRGCLVMLGGEPGIGKTRTVQELAALAQQHRVPVLWGRCYEEPGRHPTGPGYRLFAPMSRSIILNSYVLLWESVPGILPRSSLK
jgi:hypothetical protein